MPSDLADRALLAGMAGQENRFATLQVAFHGDPNVPQPDLGDRFHFYISVFHFSDFKVSSSVFAFSFLCSFLDFRFSNF